MQEAGQVAQTHLLYFVFPLSKCLDFMEAGVVRPGP